MTSAEPHHMRCPPRCVTVAVCAPRAPWTIHCCHSPRRNVIQIEKQWREAAAVDVAQHSTNDDVPDAQCDCLVHPHRTTDSCSRRRRL